MNPKLFYWMYESKTKEYTFRFDGGRITVEADNEQEARILAQAEAIKNGWDYEILPNKMTMEELKQLIDNHVNEIFREYQEVSGTHSDIMPFDAVNLQTIKEALADLVIKVCND